MRQAQAEYESCADQYQLRIKTLNKVMIPIPIPAQDLDDKQGDNADHGDHGDDKMLESECDI